MTRSCSVRECPFIEASRTSRGPPMPHRDIARQWAAVEPALLLWRKRSHGWQACVRRSHSPAKAGACLSEAREAADRSCSLWAKTRQVASCFSSVKKPQHRKDAFQGHIASSGHSRIEKRGSLPLRWEPWWLPGCGRQGWSEEWALAKGLQPSRRQSVPAEIFQSLCWLRQSNFQVY